MSNPISELGLSCPDGGTFYICQNSTQQFLGCCDDDPCADGSGECASDSLHAASFDADQYDDIPAQQCAGDDSSTYWWLCANNSPPFLGCCEQNPCDAGGCNSTDLIAAVLSDDESDAAVFLTTSSSSSSSSSPTTSATLTTARSTTPSTTTATGTAGATGASSSSSTSTTPVGAIAGGVVGGVVVLALVLVFIWWSHRKDRRQPALADQLEDQKPPSGPFGSTHAPPSTMMTTSHGLRGTDPLKGTPSAADHPAGTVSSATNTEIYEADSIMCGSPPQSTWSWTPRDSRYVSYLSTASYDMGREGVQNMHAISELDGTEVGRDNDETNQNSGGRST